MEKLEVKLNELVANLTVMYTKLHSFHWYVKGTDFFTLHEKFENYYDEVTEALDEVAERMLSLGQRPISTLKGSLEVATIKEATEDENASKMVEVLVNDNNTLISLLNEIIELADESNDPGTSGMAEELKTKLEKDNWMLNAYLNK